MCSWSNAKEANACSPKPAMPVLGSSGVCGMATAIAVDEADVRYWVDGSAAKVVDARPGHPTLRVASSDRPQGGLRGHERRAGGVRWTRVAAAAAVCALLVALGLPLRALGGGPVAQPPARSGSVLSGATVYVVQPGDTLWSIAAQFDRGGDPRPLARAIAAEIGSDSVVAGERIPIP